MMNGWRYGDHMTTWGWVWMGACMILIAAAVIGLAFMLFRRSQSGCCRRHDESPMDVLSRRYAAGELDDEEFERKRSNLLSK